MKILSTVIFIQLTTIIFSVSASAQLFRKKKDKLSANFNIQQLAPGVWAAINNDFYGKAICNAGIVDIGNKTIVFDPFMNPEAAYELKEVAKKLTGKNVTLVINSHYHSDHIRGNQAFLPTATVITTPATREAIDNNELEEQEWEKAHAPTLLQALKKRRGHTGEQNNEDIPFWIGYYEGLVESSGDLYISLADETFEDSLWIEGSKLAIKLVERKNGHTLSDVVLLIPSLGIAFMGDLLTNNRHPWISDGNIEGWRESLKVFYEDTIYHTYLPGHGDVTDKTALKTLYQYLGDIDASCYEATTEEAQVELMNRPVPYPYNSWKSSRFYQPNLQHLINEAKIKRRTLKPR